VYKIEVYNPSHDSWHTVAETETFAPEIWHRMAIMFGEALAEDRPYVRSMAFTVCTKTFKAIRILPVDESSET
jgi:hypothetical protein